MSLRALRVQATIVAVRCLRTILNLDEISYTCYATNVTIGVAFRMTSKCSLYSAYLLISDKENEQIPYSHMKGGH